MPERLSRLAGRPDARFVAGVMVVSFALRLLFIALVQRGSFAFNDMFFYHSVASMVAEGKGFKTLDGHPFAQWPPGYPMLLSLVYRFTGAQPVAAEFFNALIGTLSIPLIYATALRAFGQTEAKFCALALAFLPGQIFFADTIMSEPLFILLLLATLFTIASREPTRKTAVIIGLLIGFSMLTRGEGPIMLFMPLAAWWPRLDRRTLIERMAIIAGVTALCVVPWTIRNYTVFHKVIAVSTNFGSTFWAAHNPKADGEQSYPTPADTAAAGDPKARDYQIKQAAVLSKQAKQWIADHPFKDISLIPFRALGLTKGDGDVIYYWVNKVAANQPKPLGVAWAKRLGSMADLGWYVLLTAFVSSLIVFGRSMLKNSVLRASAAYMTVSIGLFTIILFGQFRYHVPFEPMMILAASPLIAQLVAIRKRRIKAGETR